MMGIVSDIASEFNLQSVDKHIFLLRLWGCSHIEIADQLHISTHTVAKRIKKIYKVTGSSNLLELYWRFVRERVGNVEELEQREREEERAVLVV